MKISKSALKQIIKEELANLEEQEFPDVGAFTDDQRANVRLRSGDKNRPISGATRQKAQDDFEYGPMGTDYKTRTYEHLQAAAKQLAYAGRSAAMVGSSADADPGRGRGKRAVPGAPQQMSDALMAAQQAVEEALRIASAM